MKYIFRIIALPFVLIAFLIPLVCRFIFYWLKFGGEVMAYIRPARTQGEIYDEIYELFAEIRKNNKIDSV